jgi:hypothetical protein
MERRVPALEQRIAEIISAYDAQGNHRTGTAVDEASGEWLSKQVYNIGIEAALEPFALSRVDPRSCFLRIDNRRIEGVPLFDATFTGAEGVRGKLGPLGSDAEIGVGEAIGSQAASAGEARRAATRPSSCSHGAVDPGSTCSMLTCSWIQVVHRCCKYRAPKVIG